MLVLCTDFEGNCSWVGTDDLAFFGWHSLPGWPPIQIRTSLNFAVLHALASIVSATASIWVTITTATTITTTDIAITSTLTSTVVCVVILTTVVAKICSKWEYFLAWYSQVEARRRALQSAINAPKSYLGRGLVTFIGGTEDKAQDVVSEEWGKLEVLIPLNLTRCSNQIRIWIRRCGNPNL